MEAMKCDRCGNYYIPYGPTKECLGSNTAVLALRMPNGQLSPHTRFDLCPGCMIEVATFIAPFGIDIPQQQTGARQEPADKEEENEEPTHEEEV